MTRNVARLMVSGAVAVWTSGTSFQVGREALRLKTGSSFHLPPTSLHQRSWHLYSSALALSWASQHKSAKGFSNLCASARTLSFFACSSVQRAMSPGGSSPSSSDSSTLEALIVCHQFLSIFGALTEANWGPGVGLGFILGEGLCQVRGPWFPVPEGLFGPGFTHRLTRLRKLTRRSLVPFVSAAKIKALSSASR